MTDETLQGRIDHQERRVAAIGSEYDVAGMDELTAEALRRIGARQRGPREPDPAATRDEHRRSLTDAGVVAGLAELAVDGNYTRTDALRSLDQQFDAGLCFVVLSGGVGVGKSAAAAVWLRERLVAHGRIWMRWLHAHHLARAARSDDGDQVALLEKVDFLVLDDLGTEFLDAKGWLSATLDSIVHQRHGARRPTVVTTNLDVEAFRARYGERVADRIRECGAFVHVAGGSMRGRA